MLNVVDLHQEEVLSAADMHKVAGGNAVESAAKTGVAVGAQLNSAVENVGGTIGAICGIGLGIVALLA